MSTTPKVQKKLVALGLSKLSAPQVIANTKLYVQKMTGNTNFPTPTPSLTTVSTQLATLETAYTLSQTRVKGSVSKMKVELKALEILLKNLASYVETIANADPDNAENIINSSGMPVKKPRTVQPKLFTAVLTKIPGQVRLDSKAVNRSSCYIYQMTTDPNAATSWQTILTSNNVKDLVNGLASNTRYYFRVAVSTKGIQGAWSTPINVLMP
jgi:hypothetical protein